MTGAQVHQSLVEATGALVTSYRDDLLKHDLRAITEHPGEGFLHFARDTGTHYLRLPAGKDYPAKGERIPYIFSTADRNHILNQTAPLLEAIAQSGETLAIHHFDGHRLHRITMDRARQIVTTYVEKIRAGWRR